MIAIAILFLVLSSGGFLLASLEKKYFEETLPATTMGIVFIMFIFGILGHLKLGF